MIIFLSAVDFIKKRMFDVRCPAFYHPHLPEEMVRPAPFKRPVVNRFKMTPLNRRGGIPTRAVLDPRLDLDPSQLQHASFSIEMMLDMFQRKIEFEIEKDDDLPEIFDGLDWYLNSLHENVITGDEKATQYAKLVIAWRAEVYKHYYRYIKTHPDVEATLYPNNDKTKNIFHLMSTVGGIRQEQIDMDPLAARRHPPYVVEKLIPKQVEEDPDEFGSSLGLNAGPGVKDDGKDFNFDDFLKG